MKFWEAMKALQEGKKVRVVTWQETKHIKDFRGFDADNTCVNLNYWMSYEWELYEEPEDTKLYQWRYRNGDNWYIDTALTTKEKAVTRFKLYDEHKIHAGPFEEEES